MAERLVTFPQGLVGCEDWTRFVLVELPDEPVRRLVSLEDPELAFLAAEVTDIDPEYRLELTDADRQVLGCHDRRDLQVLCTLTLHQERPMVTANLVGPLVVNRATGIAKQVVLVTGDYSVRHAVVDRLPERIDAGTD